MFNLSHILWICEFMKNLWEGEMRHEGDVESIFHMGGGWGEGKGRDFLAN